MRALPRLVVTGAAGFVGRRLVESLASAWDIHAIDRNEAPPDLDEAARKVVWHRADVADPASIGPVFARIEREGGAAALVHLAGHYDFTGEEHPEYQRTNVGGTRLLLELSRGLGLERFVFASSVAACDFPDAGRAVDESSPADGKHVYARSKRAGEELMRAAAGVPTAIVRFAAMFSDWCEYPPLYVFLETWLGRGWNRSVLGGRGRSAVPYLHVREACQAMIRLLALRRHLAPAEVVIVSPNGATTHEELYAAATSGEGGAARGAWKVPGPLAAVGIWARYQAGRLRGRPPFERPWMAGMIDRRLEVDAHRSHARLGWQPRARLDIVRRMPFLLESRRSQPWLWTLHNRIRLATDHEPLEIRALRILRQHRDEIDSSVTAGLLTERAHLPHDHAVQLLRGLRSAVRLHDREAFRELCFDLARRRAHLGMPAGELRSVLGIVERSCLASVARAAPEPEVRAYLEAAVRGAIEFGVDGLEDAYEEAGTPTALVAEERPVAPR